MTIYDLDNDIGIFQAYIEKLYIPTFMEMDGVTERDPQYMTHTVQIDIDKNQKSNFTRPADGTMLWLRFPPFL
jgi:RNA processing factor Prp31